MQIQPAPSSGTVYEAVGGSDFFVQLVDHFYAGVDTDERIRHMYPDDLTEPKRSFAGFLVQYFGGPATYSEERGHPRLRMRHAPFVIDEVARQAWMEHMTNAVTTMNPAADVQTQMMSYFDMAAQHMVNVS